jgi:hypothetical protein
MNFDTTYTYWNGEIETGSNGSGAGVLAPGVSQTIPFSLLTVRLDNTGPVGTSPYSIKIGSDNANNSPQTYNGSVFVLAHSAPQIFSYVLNKYILVPPAPATAPSPDPLAFGATGGGESFASAWGSNANRDPPEPTAGMAMFFSESGSSKITSTLSPFSSLAAIAADNQNPDDGSLYEVRCQNDQPGTYTKIFTMYFSDEQDLPGANAPGSFVAQVSYTFHIAPDGSSTYEVYLVPEPTSMVLLAIGLPVTCAVLWRGRKRARRN